MSRIHHSMIGTLGTAVLAYGLVVAGIPTDACFGFTAGTEVTTAVGGAPPAIQSIDPGALGQKGPFEIGFTSFVLTDPARPGDGAGFANRPIPVHLWYPVDPGTITASTPEAVYPLDPLYETSLVATSTDWEAYGMDRAYQQPAPSSAAPFPLVMS